MLNGSGPSGVLHAAAGGGAIAGDARMMLAGSAERITTWPPARRKPDWRLPLTGAALVHVCLLVSMLVLPGTGHQLHSGLPEVVEVALCTVEEPQPATPDVQSASQREAPPRSAPLVRRPRNNSRAAIPPPVAPQGAKDAATPHPPQPVPAQPEGASPPALSEDAGFAQTGAGAAAPNSETSTVIPARPRYRDNPPPPYPEQARRRRLEGTVVLEALVGGKGKVDNVTVHASSGHQLLDEAALRAVRDWLFEPGQRGGMPVTAKVLVPVRFALR